MGWAVTEWLIFSRGSAVREGTSDDLRPVKIGGCPC